MVMLRLRSENGRLDHGEGDEPPALGVMGCRLRSTWETTFAKPFAPENQLSLARL
jgi:hypothetical protein